MKRRETKNTISSLIMIPALLFFVIVPIGARAQTANTGIVTGVVKDEAGAVVVGAKVKARNLATGLSRTTVSNDVGAYELAQLPPGDYCVEVNQTGFARFVQEPVTVNVLARVSVYSELKPVGSAEQVMVIAEPTSLVEATKTEVSGLIGKREMEYFPVNGRSFASLASLIPGATMQPSFDPVKARSGSFSIGGSTGRNVNITVDGGDNKDNHVGGSLQSYTMESIQEFALASQRFSAANGRSSGGLLSIITKSGTNELHGSAFGFFRDDMFNANASTLLAKANPNLFDADSKVKPQFSRQQYGGSVGGPLIKDKAFWFGAVEHTRENGNSIVPSFAFDQIKLLEPLGYQPVRFLPQPYADTQFLIKGDYHAAQNHELSFRYAGQNNLSRNDQAGFLTVFTDLTGGNKQSTDLHSLLGSWTWSINPQIVNQFIYSWSTFNNQLVGASNITNLSFPDGIVTGHSEHTPEHTFQRKHQFRDDLTWNRGAHGLKFGVDFAFEPVLGGFDAAVSEPIYHFNFTIDQIVSHPDQFPKGLFTSQVLPGSITGSHVSGVGVVGEIVRAGGDPHFDLRDGAKQFSWYIQDDWRVSSRLTLNLGVRHDVDIGFLDAGRQQNNRAFKLLQIIGHPLGSRVVKDDKNNYSPRVGFAWDIKGKGQSVLRGGYGLYYDQVFLDVALHAIQQANPQIYAEIANDEQNLSLATPPPVFPNPLVNPPLGFGEISTGNLIDPSFTVPYTQQMNIGYAQEIGSSMSVELDYIHILGLHGFTESDINPRIGPLIGADRRSAVRPRMLDAAFEKHASQITSLFGQPVPFGSIMAIQSDGRSRYDAFTVRFKKKYSKHYELNAHYTLSRSVAWFGRIADFEVTPQNPFDKFDSASDFGYAGEDERHRLVVSGIFDLPGGLQAVPIFQLSSARPYSIFPDPGSGGGGDINQDGNFNDREARGGNDQRHLPPGTERGDNFAQINLRVTKFFKFRDKVRLAAFVEAFNLFNVGNFGNSYDGTVGSPNFRKPVNYFGATGFSEPLGIPFQAQFGVRLSF